MVGSLSTYRPSFRKSTMRSTGLPCLARRSSWTRPSSPCRFLLMLRWLGRCSWAPLPPWGWACLWTTGSECCQTMVSPSVPLKARLFFTSNISAHLWGLQDILWMSSLRLAASLWPSRPLRQHPDGPWSGERYHQNQQRWFSFWSELSPNVCSTSHASQGIDFRLYFSTFNWVLGITNPFDFSPPFFCAKSALEMTETPDNMFTALKSLALKIQNGQ